MPLEPAHIARRHEIGRVRIKRVRALHSRAIAARRIDVGEHLVIRIPHARAKRLADALAHHAPTPRIRRMPRALRHRFERAREYVRVRRDVDALQSLPRRQLVARSTGIDTLEAR
jgi:hypothetical protein